MKRLSTASIISPTQEEISSEPQPDDVHIITVYFKTDRMAFYLNEEQANDLARKLRDSKFNKTIHSKSVDPVTGKASEIFLILDDEYRGFRISG